MSVTDVFAWWIIVFNRAENDLDFKINAETIKKSGGGGFKVDMKLFTNHLKNKIRIPMMLNRKNYIAKITCTYFEDKFQKNVPAEKKQLYGIRLTLLRDPLTQCMSYKDDPSIDLNFASSLCPTMNEIFMKGTIVLNVKI